MLAESGVEKLLNRMELLKVIIRARLIAIEKNPVDLVFLMSRWSIETHMFVVAWGEFSPSLKDVATLMSLSLFGEAHATRVTLSWDDQKKVEFLSKSLLCFKYSTSKFTYL